MMTSTDRIIAKIDGLKIYIDGRLSAMEERLTRIETKHGEFCTELRLIDEEIRAVNTRLEDMKYYMSLTFGAIAISVAAVALSPIVSKLIDAWKKPNDDEQMRKIAREEIARVKADSDTI